MTYPLGPEYRFDIENLSGDVVAQIQDFTSFNFEIVWSGKGNFQVNMSGFDDRLGNFGDDYHIRVWFRDLAFGLGWINIFTGFVKTSVASLYENGNRTFQVYGPSLEELLEKEKISWPSGSAQATKTGAVATVMREFVDENIGSLALVASGRDYDGLITGLSTFSDGSGPTWAGSVARDPLLKTLDDLRLFSILRNDHVDFRIRKLTGYAWIFEAGKLGVDRTTRGLDPTTGLNAAGNVPITFSEGQQNVTSYTRSKSRAHALTEVVALGNGRKDDRVFMPVVDALGLAVSPIARRVGYVTVNTTDVTELQNAAEAKLREFQPTDKFSFQPRDIGDPAPVKGGTVLFRDYFPGDFITAIDQGTEFHKQVVSVSINLSESTSNIVSRTVGFADV